MKTLTRYWPWWVCVGWLLGYEVYAVVRPAAPTLSQLYWRAQDNASYLPYIVVPAIVVLLLHLVGKRWRGF